MSALSDSNSLDFVAFLSEAAKAPARPSKQQVLGAISYEQRQERAAAYLADMSVDEVKAEDNGFKLTLLTYLNHEPRPQDRPALSKLYQGFTLDRDFALDERARMNKLVETLKQQDFMASARANWPRMSTESRLDVLQKIVNLHSQAMGFAPTTLSMFRREKDAQNRLINGCLDRATGTIKLNGVEGAKFHSFGDALNLVIHENTHNHQIQLARRFTQGAVPSGDPRHTQARIFKENLKDGAYIKGELDFQTYKAQPLEAHANAAGAYVARCYLQPELSARMMARAGVGGEKTPGTEKTLSAGASMADIRRAQAKGQEVVFTLD